MKTINASGTRKRAIARATLSSGTGIVRINNLLLDNASSSLYRQKMNEPIIIAGDAAKSVNINVHVQGGGINAQAEAARLAIAKVLVEHDHKLHKDFLAYDRTLLVADVRRKETRKPNRHGKARSKRQKSYR